MQDQFANTSEAELGSLRQRLAELEAAEARRAAVEQGLEEKAARLQSILDATVDGIVTIDERGIIQSFNRSAETIFGYTAEEVIGQNVTVLQPSPYRENHDRYLANYLSTGQRKIIGIGREVKGRRKDGSTFPLYLAVSEVWAGGRRVFTGILRDITELKAIEDALRRSRDELEQRVRERTAQLLHTNRQLELEIQRRKETEEALTLYAAQLEQSNRDLQDFAFVASHDLQEPLRKIRTFGDRIEGRYGDCFDASGRDYLGRMQNAAGRMQDLILALLSYARLSTQARPISGVDLAAVVQDVLSDLEVAIERTGAVVEIGPLPVLEADAAQMHHLFQNLIANALKFQRADRPHIQVTSAPAGSGELAHFSRILVQDNGIGFDEKHLERIFTPFQRLHGRGEYEGTGMGLAICRKIVERHGGSITARSRPGAGATFIVTLPFQQKYRVQESPLLAMPRGHHGRPFTPYERPEGS